MQEVILVIHLLLALGIIGLVLIQRSEGGGLGIGSSNGGVGNLATAQGAANVLTRMTAIFATCFFITSLTLAYMAGHNNDISRVLSDQAPISSSIDNSPLDGEKVEKALELPSSDSVKENKSLNGAVSQPQVPVSE